MLFQLCNAGRFETISGLLLAAGAFAGVTAEQDARQEGARGGADELPAMVRNSVKNDLKNFNANTSKHNLEDGLALEGYDPVSYFEEGGAEPVEGSERISHEFKGATYRFATEEHREMFREDPLLYMPAYGGWCASAMAKDKRVEVDPETYRIDDGRLFVFYNPWYASSAAKSWDESPERMEDEADRLWHDYSTERPRIGGEVVSLDVAKDFD